MCIRRPGTVLCRARTGKLGPKEVKPLEIRLGFYTSDKFTSAGAFGSYFQPITSSPSDEPLF